MSNLWLWAALALVIGLDLLFTALRSGLVNAKVMQLMDLRLMSPRAVDRTLHLLERPHLRVTLRLLLAGVHLLLGALVGLTGWLVNGSGWQPWLVGLVLLLGGFGLMLCEFTVERWVLRAPEQVALRLTGLAMALDGLLRPLTSIFMAVLGASLSLERDMGNVTEDELKNWVEQETPQGGLEKEERQMIYSIFQFGDTLCREIMVPRMDVVALDVQMPLEEAVQIVIQSGHSRLPVYEDEIDNVIGLLYAKDLLKMRWGGEATPSLRSLLRPAFFVPESKKVDDLLREMQARRFHMVVVVDEYGGMAGLVTMEDIVEEIVGEIRDEYDQSEELLLQQVGDEEFLLHGRLDIEDVNAALGVHLTRDLSDTLGGYIYSQLGRVPVEGEQLTLEDWLLTMEVVTERRIRRVRAVRKSHNEETEQGESHAVDG